jgi:hypothetical protein
MNNIRYTEILARLIFTLILMTATIPNLFALQPGDTAPKPASERAEALTKSMNCEIGLLGTQVPKVYAINLEACLKMDTAAMQSKDNIGLLQKKGKLIDEERNIKLRDVLTDKQFADYERISRGNRKALKKTQMCRDVSQTW